MDVNYNNDFVLIKKDELNRFIVLDTLKRLFTMA